MLLKWIFLMVMLSIGYYANAQFVGDFMSPPLYGSAGYTTGQVNNVQPVYTGYLNTDYSGYSSNYWTCVNLYRGQYYFSYTYGAYVCDVRANRYGK